MGLTSKDTVNGGSQVKTDLTIQTLTSQKSASFTQFSGSAAQLKAKLIELSDSSKHYYVIGTASVKLADGSTVSHNLNINGYSDAGGLVIGGTSGADDAREYAVGKKGIDNNVYKLYILEVP